MSPSISSASPPSAQLMKAALATLIVQRRWQQQQENQCASLTHGYDDDDDDDDDDDNGDGHSDCRTDRRTPTHARRPTKRRTSIALAPLTQAFSITALWSDHLNCMMQQALQMALSLHQHQHQHRHHANQQQETKTAQQQQFARLHALAQHLTHQLHQAWRRTVWTIQTTATVATTASHDATQEDPGHDSSLRSPQQPRLQQPSPCQQQQARQPQDPAFLRGVAPTTAVHDWIRQHAVKAGGNNITNVSWSVRATVWNLMIMDRNEPEVERRHDQHQLDHYNKSNMNNNGSLNGNIHWFMPCLLAPVLLQGLLDILFIADHDDYRAHRPTSGRMTKATPASLLDPSEQNIHRDEHVVWMLQCLERCWRTLLLSQQQQQQQPTHQAFSIDSMQHEQQQRQYSHNVCAWLEHTVWNALPVLDADLVDWTRDCYGLLRHGGGSTSSSLSLSMVSSLSLLLNRHQAPPHLRKQQQNPTTTRSSLVSTIAPLTLGQRLLLHASLQRLAYYSVHRAAAAGTKLKWPVP